MNFEQFFDEQAEWSRATFGGDRERGPAGPLRHLVKEIGEASAEEDPAGRTEELADLVFLTFDAHRRAGGLFADLDLNDELTLTAVGELFELAADVDYLLGHAGEPGFKDAVVDDSRSLVCRIIMACWKFGVSRDQLLAACFAKLAKNKARTWPRPTSDDEPVEHDRTKD